MSKRRAYHGGQWERRLIISGIVRRRLCGRKARSQNSSCAAASAAANVSAPSAMLTTPAANWRFSLCVRAASARKFPCAKTLCRVIDNAEHRERFFRKVEESPFFLIFNSALSEALEKAPARLRQFWSIQLFFLIPFVKTFGN
jgi:hypothetical protein